MEVYTEFLSYGLCRFCSAEGQHRDIMKDYMWNGCRENSSVMFLECFNIFISISAGSSSSICAPCCKRLRDACEFRKMVLAAEHCMLDTLDNENVELKLPVGSTLLVSIKPEPLEVKPVKTEPCDEADVSPPSLFVDESEVPKTDKKGTPKKRQKGKTKKTQKNPHKESVRKKTNNLADEVSKKYYRSDEGPCAEYVCRECGARRGSVRQMRVHVFDKHVDRQLRCPLCDHSARTREQRRRHLLAAHQMEEHARGSERELKPASVYSCDTCDHTFTTRRNLFYHVNKLHRLLACPECPRRLPRVRLRLHRHEAHGVPIPTCGVCGYKNEHLGNVERHQRRLHLKEKTVPCEICHEQFFNHDGLKMHMVRHKADKKFSCSFCAKQFPRGSALRRHEMIHLGRKDKVCSLCGAGFVQKTSLDYHTRKHHPEAT